MVKIKGELRPEFITKFIFKAPNFIISLVFIAALGLFVDLISYFAGLGIPRGFGLAFSIPALISAVLTTPCLRLFSNNKFFLKRSSMLAFFCELSMIILMILSFIGGMGLAFALGVGFVFSIRLMVLTAIVDYRARRMIIPALIHPLLSSAAGIYFFGTGFIIQAAAAIVIFGLFMLYMLHLFDLPLKKTFGLSGMRYVNIFFRNLINSPGAAESMEEYISVIAEKATVDETTFFFRREGKKDIYFVIPNLHPGPLSNIGGSNFPKTLQDSFRDDAVVLISHGCATHDLNLISNKETSKIRDAIVQSRKSVNYSKLASKPARTQYGDVSFLSQRFGDSILIVTTRSPYMTEDLDYSVGRIIAGEGRSMYENVGFVDAHNCMVEKQSHIIYPSTTEGSEFITGGCDAMKSMLKADMHEFRAGAASVRLPYSAEQGFGQMDLMTLVIEAGGSRTAYVIFDGNNILEGVRDKIRDAVLKLGFDEAEIMTDDTHIVNSLSGKNPVGMKIPAEEIIPYVIDAVRSAESDLSPAQAGAASEMCRDVDIFGPGKIIRLAALVGGIVTNLLPYIGMATISSMLLTIVLCVMLM